MYWEGLLIISRSHYEALGPDRRFILTKKVHDRLHPEIPEKYIGKSIMIFGEPGGDIEYEIEGQNFLAVSTPQVREFLTMSPKEAAKRYSDDWAECQFTGSSLVAKLYQAEQDAKIDDDEFQKKPKKRLFRFRSAISAEDPTDNESSAADDIPDGKEKSARTRTARMAIKSLIKKDTPAAEEGTPGTATQDGIAKTEKPSRTRTARMAIKSLLKRDTSDTGKETTAAAPQEPAAQAGSPEAETVRPAAKPAKKKETSKPVRKTSSKTAQTQPSEKTEKKSASKNDLPSRNYEIKKDTEKNKWCLKAIGASRAIGYYKTKAEATEKLNSLLANNSNASATIHKVDGTYQKHDAASVRKGTSRDTAKTQTSKKKRTS